MASYKVEKSTVTVSGKDATLFRVGFGDPAQNDVIVRDADAALYMMELEDVDRNQLGGELALVNGPASLPVAVVIAHHLLHRFGAVAVFDPKMAAYVVAAAHGGDRKAGDLIPAVDVK